jgi:chromosome partitioning protein
MHTIVLASQKGGAGKTTLTGHLGVAAELAGDGPAVLIDTDPQGSLTAWWNAREAEVPALAAAPITKLSTKLPALAAAGYAYVLIDTPPAITDSIRAVVALADFVIVPVRASPHDLRAVGRTVDLVRAERKPFCFAVTQAKSNANLTLQVMGALSVHGVVSAAVMHDRVDYAASMSDGRTVLETDRKGRSADEMRALWAFVKERMNARTQARKDVA